MPDKTTIAMVRESFELANHHSDDFVLRFYARLFAIAPHVKPLFKGDIELQSRKLHATLCLALNALEHPEQLVDALKAHGVTHAERGVKVSDYELVADAFVDTLEDTLGPHWKAEYDEAWSAVLSFVSATMIAGATEAAVRAKLAS